MKLIIENSQNMIFVYFETEKHFKKVEKHRSTSLKRISASSLIHECKLDINSYVVIDDIRKNKQLQN